MILTGHAAVRARQRAIPPFVVELLLDHGASVRHQGADVYYLDKASRRQLRRHLGASIFARIEDQLDAYAVVADDGRLITITHRHRRLKRP